MDKSKIIGISISEHLNLVKKIYRENADSIDEISTLISNKIKSGKTIFWCGNGGSAGDSQHLSAELVGRFQKNRKPLSSISLTTDISALTCISNDFSYEVIFSRQLEALGKSGDVLIAISTSGNSKNIISALRKARDMNIISVGFLGKNGGEAKDLCNYSFIVPSSNTARIQEVHILLGHIICEYIDFDYEKL